MKVYTILSPYDSGYFARRMGAGPIHIQASGLETALAADGHTLVSETLTPSAAFPAEIALAFELQRLGAEATRRALADDAFPLLLAGNCNASIGPVTGAGADGIVWFDAHGDFNTPETTEMGFFDGMGLAALTGRCWRTMTAQIDGFQPLAEANVVHVGGRDFDAQEAGLLHDSALTLIPPSEVRQSGIARGLDALDRRVSRLHIHVDLDVLDPATVGQVNLFAAPDGLGVQHVIDAISDAHQHFEVVSASVSAYDPSHDTDGAVLRAAMAVIRALAGHDVRISAA
ncbi:MAG: arginase family protein [Anaerolineae bacterium]|nr:arginase family protein [Anaerolineae bacterium]